MINALTQSPLVSKKIFEWKEKLEKNELLVRDIIDIDSTYEDFENDENESKKVKKVEKDKDKLKTKKTEEKEGDGEKSEEYTDQMTSSMFLWLLWKKK